MALWAILADMSGGLGQVDLAKAITIERDYETSTDFTLQLGRWISAKGMLIPLRKHVDPGTPIRFAFTLKGGKRDILRGHGKVVWYKDASGKRPAGIGIGFLDLSDRSKKNIKQILTWKDANGLA